MSGDAPPPRIGIIGAGAWGTALACVLGGRGHSVELWCYEPELAVEVAERHTNGRYLPGVVLPASVHASPDIAAVAEGRDYLFLAVPSLYLLTAARRIAESRSIREGRTPIAILTKGLIDTPHGVRLITDAVEDCLPGSYQGRLVYVSGPSHAEEVARGRLTGLISASRSARLSIRFRELLAGPSLVVYSSLDVRGVQVAAAMKNVVAIAFGMLDALKESSDRFGDNTESLLLAAGLNEIRELGRALGATHPETFASLAGVGDLDVTCRSVLGRNRRFGREIILKSLIEGCASIDEVIAAMPGFGYIAEGVVTAKHVHTLSLQRRLSLPIAEGVYQVLDRTIDPVREIEAMLQAITVRPRGPREGRRAGPVAPLRRLLRRPPRPGES